MKCSTAWPGHCNKYLVKTKLMVHQVKVSPQQEPIKRFNVKFTERDMELVRVEGCNKMVILN